jgi:hypothetical protein
MVEFMPNVWSSESSKPNAHAASSPVGEIAIHNRGLCIKTHCCRPRKAANGLPNPLLLSILFAADFNVSVSDGPTIETPARNWLLQVR